MLTQGSWQRQNYFGVMLTMGNNIRQSLQSKVTKHRKQFAVGENLQSYKRKKLEPNNVIIEEQSKRKKLTYL
jgi:hypothetical protein